MNCPFCDGKKTGILYDTSICENGHKYYFCKPCEETLIYYLDKGPFSLNSDGVCNFDKDYKPAEQLSEYKRFNCKERKCFVTQYENELSF